MNRAVRILAIVCLSICATGSRAWSEEKPATRPTFTLWQLPNQTSTQMMSYVIRTVHGRLIVIDGGNKGDAAYLKQFIKERGNAVDAWLITHPHDDHVDALCEILAAPDGMSIKTIYASLPDVAWMQQHASPEDADTLVRFLDTLAKAGRRIEEFALGAESEIDDVRIQVLGIRNPEITKNAVNNSSVVLRVSDASKSVLFPGDLGVEGGEKLLASKYAKRLPSDYVQMAHHGQNGVSEAFYEKVRASYCLWPTPKWLWDNDNGGGKGSGRWRTLEVRAWMDKQPIKKHFVMWEGLQQVD